MITFSFLFNLVGYLTRDVCVGMAGLRMQDSGEGDIEDIGYGRLGVHGRPFFSFPAPPLHAIAPRPPRCSLMLRERREAQVVVAWALLGSGGQSAGTLGVAARVWAKRISKV